MELIDGVLSGMGRYRGLLDRLGKRVSGFDAPSCLSRAVSRAAALSPKLGSRNHQGVTSLVVRTLRCGTTNPKKPRFDSGVAQAFAGHPPSGPGQPRHTFCLISSFHAPLHIPLPIPARPVPTSPSIGSQAARIVLVLTSGTSSRKPSPFSAHRFPRSQQQPAATMLAGFPWTNGTGIGW
ncbi:hypothetical protein BT67DRAFT_60222 [Trichocladium antarcticum]|uniref:Uncharacterized protein n=1 Tax=Trichocladium antarcticum TaxID=1450529 RepID=A0AAN6ZCV1_9PEZI|nr:hypothetical protein BT67DRAFT_60222 [Trichocladium antarcticum]